MRDALLALIILALLFKTFRRPEIGAYTWALLASP